MEKKIEEGTSPKKGNYSRHLLKKYTSSYVEKTQLQAPYNLQELLPVIYMKSVKRPTCKYITMKFQDTKDKKEIWNTSKVKKIKKEHSMK